MSMDVRSTLALVVIAVFAIVGIASALWPRAVQEWVLRLYEARPGLVAWNPFLSWMRTSSYVAFLRAMGVVICAAVMVIVVLAIYRRWS